MGLFRAAATSGCPSGEERTPRSVDWGVFHFRGGEAEIRSIRGVRAVVSHSSLGGPGRSCGLADNTKSRCLSLLVSPHELSLVKSVRANECPPGACAEGRGSWPAAKKLRPVEVSQALPQWPPQAHDACVIIPASLRSIPPTDGLHRPSWVDHHSARTIRHRFSCLLQDVDHLFRAQLWSNGE